jgi:hypothetical protein
MTRAAAIELGAALALGAAMTAIEYHAQGQVFGFFGALALLLGIVVSGSMQENPVMIGTIVVFWAAITWVVLRVVRLIVTAARSTSDGA